MYTINGREFSELVNREFTDNYGRQEHAMEKNGHFSARTSLIKTNHFNILNFRAAFDVDLEVKDFKDFNHTSFHFQLSGYSDARISGFKHALPFDTGQYNVMNCVDPVSNYAFCQRHDYGYVCIGLNQAYLYTFLQECGPEWEPMAAHIRAEQPFALFEKPKSFPLQSQHILATILDPPIADALKKAFIQAKVEELILLSLNHSLTGTEVGSYPVFHQRDIQLLRQLKEFIDNHYLQPLSLRQLAREVGLNEFKLKRGFKHLFNCTVFGYIHRLRMEHSLQLLRNTEYTISEIAGQTGYFSDASFSRAFKGYFGFTPSAGRLSRA